MPSKTHDVKRYFIGIWSAFALWTGVVVTVLALTNEPTPDWVTSVLLVLHGVAGAVIGFMHGATAMYAKQLDEDDTSGENHDGEEDDSHSECVG